MKSLELNLNKRLLIVESGEIKLGKEGIIYKDKKSHVSDLIEGDFKLICKGSDLTEEIAKGFIPIDEKEARIKYPKAFLISYKRFQNAFIDVIESNGWYWGENPVKKPEYSIENYDTSKVEFERYESDAQKYEEAESRTFKPSKCLIFEIV